MQSIFTPLVYTKRRTAWQPGKLFKITKNHKTNDDGSSGVIDTEDSGTAGQRDSRQREAEQINSNLLATLILSAPVMTVSEVGSTTFEPDGGTTSSTAVYCD